MPSSPADVPSWKSHDDVLVDVGREVPGFGGAFLEDGESRLAVWLLRGTPAGASERAARAIAAAFDDERLARLPTRVLIAEHSWEDLQLWRQQLAPALSVDWTTLDIDDTRNRIKVGISDPADTAAVKAAARRLGIPDSAVEVEQRDAFQPLSLRGLHRPLVGGLQVSSVLGTCTAGFPATRNGIRGIVTNSHCTTTWGGTSTGDNADATAFGQPLAANFFGTESRDGRLLTSNCPYQGLQCRYADAAFIPVTLLGVSANLGRIAWPPAEGSYQWDGSTTRRIIARSNPSVVGQNVAKVGRTTGRTSGAVTELCIDALYQAPTGNTVPGSADGKAVLLCQATASLTSAGGDSGAAVFRRDSGDALDATLKGLHWGGTGSSIAFSPIGNVRNAYELGNIYVCDPLYGC